MDHGKATAFARETNVTTSALRPWGVRPGPRSCTANGGGQQLTLALVNLSERPTASLEMHRKRHDESATQRGCPPDDVGHGLPRVAHNEEPHVMHNSCSQHLALLLRHSPKPIARQKGPAALRAMSRAATPLREARQQRGRPATVPMQRHVACIT